MTVAKKHFIVSAKHIDVYNPVLSFHVCWDFPPFLFDKCSILFKTPFPKIFKVISLFPHALSCRVVTCLQACAVCDPKEP